MKNYLTVPVTEITSREMNDAYERYILKRGEGGRYERTINYDHVRLAVAFIQAQHACGVRPSERRQRVSRTYDLWAGRRLATTDIMIAQGLTGYERGFETRPVFPYTSRMKFYVGHPIEDLEYLRELASILDRKYALEAENGEFVSDAVEQHLEAIAPSAPPAPKETVTIHLVLEVTL